MSASYVLSAAAFGPWAGAPGRSSGPERRPVGRRALYATGMTLFILVLDAGWDAPWPHLCLVLTGLATPQTGSMVRARWSHLLTDREQRHGLLDRGRPRRGGLCPRSRPGHVPDPARQRRLRPAVRRRPQPCWAAGRWPCNVAPLPRPATVATPRGEPIRWTVLGPLVVVSMTLGIIFGSAEVIIAAFTTSMATRARPGWRAGRLGCRQSHRRRDRRGSAESGQPAAAAAGDRSWR
ncbi:hypothetical protein [Aeromicrobium sp. UC242_57]|uniref:hypothetical protein n=1 Tax=Aeromicrobium sp. UC242_57 TaxID=3374624 RepID=UPI00378F6084